MDLLYELASDEYLDSDPTSAYERWADDNGYDPDSESDGPVWQQQLADILYPVLSVRWRLTITVWDTEPPRDRLPSAAEMLEHLVDDYGDDCGFPEAYDAMVKASHHRDVIAAFDRGLTLLASKSATFRIAKDRVGTMTVTWDDHGQPLLDGAPMYRKVKP